MNIETIMEEIRRRAADRKKAHPEIEDYVASLRTLAPEAGGNPRDGDLDANLHGANLSCDPTRLPPGTRHWRLKQVVLRVARLFMRGQVEYNAFVVRTLNSMRRLAADSALENDRLKKELAGLSGRFSSLAREQAEVVELVRCLGEIRGQKEVVKFPDLESERLGLLAARSEGAGSLPNRAAFAEEFLGPETRTKILWQPYVDLFRHHEPTVVLECGRGEFLEMLRDSGIHSYGVEGDETLVSHALRKGLSVSREDFIAFLNKQQDGSLGGVFAARVLERLDWPALRLLVALLWKKLAVGGVAVLECFNPACLRVHLDGVYADPTHIRPYDPSGIAFLCRNAGFLEVEVRYHDPVDPPDNVPLGSSYRSCAILARR